MSDDALEEIERLKRENKTLLLSKIDEIQTRKHRAWVMQGELVSAQEALKDRDAEITRLNNELTVTAMQNIALNWPEVEANLIIDTLASTLMSIKQLIHLREKRRDSAQFITVGEIEELNEEGLAEYIKYVEKKNAKK